MVKHAATFWLDKMNNMLAGAPIFFGRGIAMLLQNIESEWDRPSIPAAVLAAAIERLRGRPIALASMSRLCRSTIGEAVIGAGRKGVRRRYSAKDAVLMILGIDLLALGLVPNRVRGCVEAARGAFDFLVPPCIDELFLYQNRDQRRWYLVAGYDPICQEFTAKVRPDLFLNDSGEVTCRPILATCDLDFLFRNTILNLLAEIASVALGPKTKLSEGLIVATLKAVVARNKSMGSNDV